VAHDRSRRQADEEQVSLGLFVRYDRSIAALVWPPVSVMQRRAVPVILRQALALRFPTP
jgi:hypothetical protein